MRIIRASEVGRYGYCARAWWLQYIQGVEPENRVALEQGLQAHAAHGRRTHAAECWAWAYRILVIAAVALLALWALSLTLS